MSAPLARTERSERGNTVTRPWLLSCGVRKQTSWPVCVAVNEPRGVALHRKTIVARNAKVTRSLAHPAGSCIARPERRMRGPAHCASQRRPFTHYTIAEGRGRAIDDTADLVPTAVGAAERVRDSHVFAARPDHLDSLRVALHERPVRVARPCEGFDGRGPVRTTRVPSWSSTRA